MYAEFPVSSSSWLYTIACTNNYQKTTLIGQKHKEILAFSGKFCRYFFLKF